MGILIGSQSISKIFLATPNSASLTDPNTITGSVYTLPSSSYTGSGDWGNTNTTIGGVATLFNGPLLQGTNGRWQFNGTSQYLTLTQSVIDNQFQQYDALPLFQQFTFFFKGTIGSLSTRRALFGANGDLAESYSNGGDAILRTDTTSSGFIDLDLRSPGAPFGDFNRFTLTGQSGSLLNIAISQDVIGNQTVYQDGNIVATKAGNATYGYAPFNVRDNAADKNTLLLYNLDTDTDNYNGQLEWVYLYNRPLSQAQIREISVQAPNGISEVRNVYLGNNLIYNVEAPYDNVVTDGLYMDFRQSTYTTGSLIWSSSIASSPQISGAFSSEPQVLSSSVYLTSDTLTATYVSASEAHADWTVVIYSKYNSPANNSTVWNRGANLTKRFVHNGATDRYWIINSSGTDYGLEEVSGSTWLNSNFFVDTLVGTGSNFIQYQNQAQTQNTAATTAKVNWATNGGASPLEIKISPAYVKRILVYNRALTADEVVTNYNAMTGSNN
jgi:hypothetical protein